LLALQAAASRADHLTWVGRTVEVLVEGPSKNAFKSEAAGPRQLTGRTMTDHIAVFDGPERLVGRTVRVEVEAATAYTLFGRVATGEQVGVEPERGADEAAPRSTLHAPRPEESGRVSLPLV